MFHINYKIFNHIVNEVNELRGADGYFQIQVGDSKYGLMLTEDLDAFSVSVYWWFIYFLEALYLIQREDQVYISDIETPQVWIELKRINNDKLLISEAHATKPEGSHAVVCTISNKVTYPAWSGKPVLFTEFRDELLTSSISYLNDLYKINAKSHPNLIKLKTLIDKVKK
ncbi:hypothetical protein ABNN70_00605 [Sporolactobacillus sp. Y61]|uniref:Uncharacterized protein n=1 Tax=Sporolactobacillus sp. Y61 TaxID=3160863 RepID=A0AAU8IGM6_9BACL|nr:hypothetical protein [Sporolactobacillus sp. THM19-2]RYL87084.1 hypothetical protein EWH91_13405 [Sporolactobacillus sp. THM19-2]